MSMGMGMGLGLGLGLEPGLEDRDRGDLLKCQRCSVWVVPELAKCSHLHAIRQKYKVSGRWLEQQPESVLCKKLCIDWLGWFGKRRIRVDHLPSEKPDPAE